MSELVIKSENIYDINFNANQIKFLRDSKIRKQPTMMSVIKNFHLNIKQPGCYNESEQVLIKKKDRLIISKSHGYAIIEGRNDTGYFSTTLPWLDYVKLTQKNTYVPIAVFTVS